MKLCEHVVSNTIHIVDPRIYLSGNKYSFCGLTNILPNYKFSDYKFFDGSTNEVNCGTCKVMAQNYIIRKLKQEI